MTRKVLSIIMILSMGISTFAQVKPRPILNGAQGRRYLAKKAATSTSTSIDAKERESIEWPLLTVGTHEDAALQSTGSPKIPVILVQFYDLKFSVAENDDAVNDYFDKFCNGLRNGQRYTGAGSFGSVRDYFDDQSGSQFLPEFVVIGPITLDEGYAYYGANKGGTKDSNITLFYQEALRKATSLVDGWDIFDNDNNGKVDLAYFIYAGEGENGCDDPNTIWPKESTKSVTINGIQFATYACCNELYGDVCDGIGVMCHELSHALGLPDLYDTNYVAYGMDYWDLMDSGNYCNKGYQPCGYSAYEKDFMGWKKLKVVDSSICQNLELYPLTNNGEGYKIVNSYNPKEYYILENRQNFGWDKYIGRGVDKLLHHGMLITHVDYDESAWCNNRVNKDSSHQRFTIVPADGQLHSYMYVETQELYTEYMYSANGDPFPGHDGVNRLYINQQPTFTKNSRMPLHLSNIQESTDGVVSLLLSVPEDANLDGTVNSLDVLKIYKYMQTSTGENEAETEDVNTDDTVNSLDVLKVYKYMQTH